MSTDLVIHAGLSKTATTTVQNRLMEGAPHYLGRYAAGEGKFVPELMELARRWPFMRQAEVASRTRAWTDRVAAEAQGADAVPVVTLSCEQLLNWRIYDTDFRKGGLAVSPRGLPWCQARRSGGWPLAGYLAEHLVPAWSRHGRVRVAVALRRQPEWLASQYAQISSRIWSPSQSDFEAQVAELIARGDQYLFWDRMVEELASAAGEANLHVFLFEDLARAETWSALARYLGLSPDDPRIEEARLARSNQRSGAGLKEWAVRRSRGRLLEQSIDITWPEGMLSAIRPAALRTAAAFDRVISSRLTPAPPEEQVIRLTSDVTGMIRTYCRDSNRRLSRLLQRDVESLGY